MAERKKFVDVNVLLLEKDIQVLGTLKELDKRTIKLDLSRKLRGKGVIVVFQIFNIEEKLFAIPKKIEIIKSYLKRIIRKGTDNVEDSFVVNCMDIRAIMKPFLITRKKVSRAVRKNLRNTAREFLINYAKEKKYNEVCEEILEGNIQKALLPKLKKVYPLAFCDLRVFESSDLSKLNVKEIIEKKTNELNLLDEEDDFEEKGEIDEGFEEEGEIDGGGDEIEEKKEDIGGLEKSECVEEEDNVKEKVIEKKKTKKTVKKIEKKKEVEDDSSEEDKKDAIKE